MEGGEGGGRPSWAFSRLRTVGQGLRCSGAIFAIFFKFFPRNKTTIYIFKKFFFKQGVSDSRDLFKESIIYKQSAFEGVFWGRCFLSAFFLYRITCNFFVSSKGSRCTYPCSLILCIFRNELAMVISFCA